MPLHLDGYFCRTMPVVKFNDEKQEYEVIEDREESEKEGTWMYLFVDLVFVALISKLAAVMENCAISFHSMSFVCTMMSIMFVTRLYLDEYCGRFYVNDLFHRLIYFMYTMSMFIMALNINAAPTDGGESDALCNANLYGYGFGMAFLMSRFLMLLLYLSVIWADHKMALTQFIGPCFRCCMSFVVVLALVSADAEAEDAGEPDDQYPFPPAYRMNIYMTALMLEVGHSLVTHIFKAIDKAGYTMDHIIGHCFWHSLCGTEQFNLDIEAYQERIGAFLLMVLGEAVIGLLVPYFDVENAEETYKFSTISCFIIFCYGLEYFDAANSKDKGQHAMTHSVTMSFLYTWIHLPLAFGMFFTAAGMSICYEKSLEEGEETEAPEAGEESGSSSSSSSSANSTLADRDREQKDAPPQPVLMLAKLVPKMVRWLQEEAAVPPASDKEKTDDHALALTWDHEPMFEPTVLLAGSIGCTILCLAILRNLHVGLDRLFARGEGKRRCEFILKCLFGLVHFTVPAYGFKKNSYNAFTHACFIAAMIIYEAKVGGVEKGEEGGGGENEASEKKEQKGEHTHRAVGMSALASKQTLEKQAAADANGSSRSAFANRLMNLSAKRGSRNSLSSSGSGSGSSRGVSERVSEGRKSMTEGQGRNSTGKRDARKSMTLTNAPDSVGVEMMDAAENPITSTRRL